MPTHDTKHIPSPLAPWRGNVNPHPKKSPLGDLGAWRETTLGEIAEKIFSWWTPSTKEESYYWWDIPWIRTQEVNFNYIKDAEIKITEKWFNNSSAKWIPKNTVIIAMYGNSAGRVAYSEIKATTNQACCNFIAAKDSADSRFIFFHLLNRYSEIEWMANGAAQQNLSVGVLKELKILLPPLPEQRAIADMLSSLDAKIELLREQNEILEKTAQTIFHEWFGRYSVESPEEWRVGKLGEVIDIRWGGTPSTTNHDFWDWDISWTSPKDLSNSKEVFLLQTENKITIEWLKQISSWLLPIWTLLLSSRAPIWYLALTNIEVAINQGYIAFVEWNYFWNKFMYLWLKSNMQTVLNSANGSTFLEISKSSFRNIEVVIPEKNAINEFEARVNPMFEKILSNLLQIKSLSKTRDTLLPKLMSGEVRVV